MTELNDRGRAFRSTIAAFIEVRREAKLKGKDDDAEAASKYDYGTWLADAAERSKHLQSVTHVLKATHPSARGSNAYVPPSHMIDHPEVGTHSLADSFVEDTAVSDAKHLDVFAFLKLLFEGQRIIDWVRDDDPDLRAALHLDGHVADIWMTAFKGLIRMDATLASHPLAKQVYWLTGERPSNDADYHLLQPLFSSSLAHAAHAEIQDARFGDENKLARQAFRAKEAHQAPYRDFRNLVARKLGGTKPQNISQLNSERGGINYLLASLPPPKWGQDRFRQLLNTETALDRFAHFKGVRFLIKALADFLLSDPDRNVQTRDRREAIEQALAFQLPVFAASVQANSEPGWTRSPDCTLPLCEQLWLDPERIELPPREGPEQEDEDFAAAYHRGDWPEEVAGRFANWVNAQLREAGLVTVGDAEYGHWARLAIVDAAWPVPVKRRAPEGASA